MPTVATRDAAHDLKLWTDEEFLAWLEADRHADLINGERYMHSPVSFIHARMTNFLDHLLRSYLGRSGVGGELHREVIAVRLSLRNVFMPDLSWFTEKQVAKLEPNHAPFAPTWVCEVLSPRTAKRDLGVKFAHYEAAGVREYWILDPESFEHRFYTQAGSALVEYASEGEWIPSRCIRGFKVRRSWLHPERHPDVERALEAIFKK